MNRKVRQGNFWENQLENGGQNEENGGATGRN